MSADRLSPDGERPKTTFEIFSELLHASLPPIGVCTICGRLYYSVREGDLVCTWPPPGSSEECGGQVVLVSDGVGT